MKQIINGDVKETHLCSECAEKAGLLNKSFSFNDMFKDLFNITADSAFLGNGSSVISDKCPICGQTYDQFRQSGRFGCGDCITAFSPYMDSVLKSIHGSNEHKGKIPHKSGGMLAEKREKDILKRKLAAAIENEEFEEAAKLRDRLKEFDKKDGDK